MSIAKKVLLLDDDLLHLFTSSSDESADELEVHNVLYNNQKSRNTIMNFCEEVVEHYSDQEFITHFRVTKNLWETLVEKFRSSQIYNNLIARANSRSNITPRKHLLVFLWFAGHQTSSFRDVADRFDLSISSLYDVITRVMMFLSSMSCEIIKFPTDLKKQEKKLFYDMKGPIDGSHIRIDRPNDRPVDYFNRKDYHSVVLQAICNEKLQFLDIYVGYPGSVHDARVFRNSPLFNQLHELCNAGKYILGDSAYPLLPTLLTPFRDNGHLNVAQKNFNTKLSSCRVAIEHSFGLLKQRFRQLYHLKLKGPTLICHFIRACCVLHNLLCADDNLQFILEDNTVDDQPDNLQYQERSTREASELRDSICRDLYRRNKIN